MVQDSFLQRFSTPAISIGLIIFITIGILILFSFGITQVSGLTFAEVSSIIAGYGTIILSAILAYLYVKMWRTQEQRTDIHSEQRELMKKQTSIQEKQNKMIEIEKRAITDIMKWWTMEHMFYIRLSNHGRGAIKRAILEVKISTNAENIESEWRENEMRKSASDDRLSKGLTSAKVVGPNQTEITMGCSPTFSVSIDGKKIEDSIDEITHRLDREGIEEATIKIRFNTLDEFGNRATEKITEQTTAIYRTTLEEAIY